jgi:hypothetical protein
MPTAPPLRKSPARGPASPWIPLFAAVIVALGPVVPVCGAAPMAYAQANKDDLAATVAKLNKKALDEYDNLNFEEARKILKDALDFCKEAGLDQHPITARTNLHLGVVLLTGFKQRDAATKYFRKALEIQPDIKMTKSLANPEIQAAFDEVVAALGKAGGGPKTAVRSGADSGLSHEPVTRASRGQGIPINVTLDPALTADRVVLSFRGAGAAEFSTSDMREATPGNYIAEIPSGATGGNHVAYFVEAQKGGQSVATAGTKASPLITSLVGAAPVAGVQRPHEKQPATPPPAEEEGAHVFVGLGVGSGIGWTTGSGDISSSHVASPAGVGAAQIVHLTPELGYFLTPDLLLSVQARIQFLSGLVGGCAGCAAPPSTAIAAFAKLTWLFGSDKLRPYVSASAGGGRIRHVADFSWIKQCGSSGMDGCVDSIPAGSVLLGPGAGILYGMSPNFGFLAGVNTQVGFPDFTFNVDLNLGIAAQF